MASAPIKFRCYRCNQLLGVARSKAGSVVACPKCSAELLVPDVEHDELPTSDDSAALPIESSTSWPGLGKTPASESRPGVLDSGVPLGYLDLRPEDIRIEPGVRSSVPSPAPRPPSYPSDEPRPSAGTETREPVAARPAPVSIPPDPEPALPPIQIEARGSSPSRVVHHGSPRPRDLILPRSVVASWSLLVLLAVAFAFLTGLLAGHYIWRVH